MSKCAFKTTLRVILLPVYWSPSPCKADAGCGRWWHGGENATTSLTPPARDAVLDTFLQNA
ncbi:hypothetical protein PR002_g6271 [Phytophthora rubi]|uniref:Pectate lyase n=1 Tax=Phytophthora rubi TaxID=129364 RepID=A0A6A3N3L8_9STRA|nr:hypothetical protein PR002_g6271 [Phytophthora rubi]